MIEYEPKSRDCIINKFPHKGICPSGWHLPTAGDWEVLQKNVRYDYEGLAAKVEWIFNDGIGVSASTKGENLYAFNVYPSGIREFQTTRTDGVCKLVPKYLGGECGAMFWASADSTSYDAPCFGIKTTLFNNKAEIMGSMSGCGKGEALSVRCVKD